MGIFSIFVMRVIAKKTLREFWERHPRSEQSLKSWYKEVEAAHWNTPSEIKKSYASASFLNDNRVIFNIKGNDFRLVTRINYEFKLVWIRFIGTHEEYDKIDATKI
ncbi:MAG: hypothetical protein RLZZ77_76 [Bacteroidota bacterium]